MTNNTDGNGFACNECTRNNFTKTKKWEVKKKEETLIDVHSNKVVTTMHTHTTCLKNLFLFIR